MLPYLLIAPLSESSLEYPSDYLLAQMARLLLLVCGLSASHGLQLAQSVRPVSAATCAARAVPAMLLGMGGPQTAVPRTVGEAKALQQVTINWRLPCLGLARRAHPHERGRSRSARTRPPQGSLGGARGRLTTHRPPLTTHRSPITDHRSLLTAHRSPRTAHGSRLTVHRSPLAAHQSQAAFQAAYGKPTPMLAQGFVGELLTSVTLATVHPTYKYTRVMAVGFEARREC